MSKKHIIHSESFRREAVQLLETSGRSVSELARELGVNAKSLYRWRRQYGTESSAAVPSEPDERDAEIKRLRRELAIVQQERDILKKTISIFSRSQS
jgi:transposase